MRKITQQASDAFFNRGNFKGKNTYVTCFATISHLYLFNNRIARRHEGDTFFTLAGYNTATTRERLNGVLFGKITTKKGKVFYEKHGEKYELEEDGLVPSGI